jgi:hypothetical protein
MGLREYAALTETVDIEADWIRLKHHPHSRFLSRDDVCTDLSTTHWEVEKHFQIQTSMIGCLCSYDSRTIYRFYSTTTRTGSLPHPPKFKGLLYVMRLLVNQGFTDWKKWSILSTSDHGTITFSSPKQGSRYHTKCTESYDLPHVSRADRRNRPVHLAGHRRRL